MEQTQAAPGTISKKDPHTVLVTPFVVLDRQRHTYLVYRQHHESTFFIQMNGEGLVCEEMDTHDFWSEFDHLEYRDVPAAVERFCKAAQLFGASDEVQQELAALNGRLKPTKQGVDMATKRAPAKPAEEKPAAKATKAASGKAPAKAAPEKTSAKAAKAAKAASDEGDGRSRTGVGAYITEQLLAGKDTETIVAGIRSKFPDSKSEAKDVSWYRSKLKREGKLA